MPCSAEGHCLDDRMSGVEEGKGSSLRVFRVKDCSGSEWLCISGQLALSCNRLRYQGLWSSIPVTPTLGPEASVPTFAQRSVALRVPSLVSFLKFSAGLSFGFGIHEPIKTSFQNWSFSSKWSVGGGFSSRAKSANCRRE